MRLGRKLLATLLVVCLALTVVNGTAGAAGTSGLVLTAGEAAAARRAYVDAKAGSNAALPSRTADVTELDGIPLPPEIRDLTSFKNGDVTIIVTVPALSASSFAASRGMRVDELSTEQASPAITAARAAQDSVLSRLSMAGVKVRDLERFVITFSGFAATVRQSDMGAIATIAGKENVSIARLYEADLASSKTIIGSGPTGVWSDPGVDGTGMAVGVIDTGIDYTHPDFGGTPASTFPTTKVPAGYDFGDNDADPMDTNGHGTHVAGIIAADGVVQGVARKARIVFAKIVSSDEGSASSATIIRAFEYMADPNNVDGGPEGTHPRVTSVNMSFGSVAGFVGTADPEHVAIQACVDQGIVVSLSAGNSGSHYDGSGYYGYYQYPDNATVGDPSVTAGSIAVASSENATAPGVALTELTSGKKVVYAEGSTSPLMPDALGDNGGLGYAYINCGLGQTSDFVGKDLTGKLALIRRGTINFTAKINNAAAAGAVGAIIYNNAAGTISMNTAGSSLPSCSITQADGVALAAIADINRAIAFTGEIFLDNPNPLFDTISSFSSWGSPPDLSFKPTLTAPGGNIWSTVPVAQGGYANYSGTSMAAPHVAAAAALIREAHPSWSSAQVRVALANTAELLTDPRSSAGLPYSPRAMGAGRINVSNALHTDVTVASAADGLPYVTLGTLRDYATTPTVFALQLRNTGAVPVTYAIEANAQWTTYTNIATPIPGAVVTTEPADSVTVPAGGVQTVTVTVDATAVALAWNYMPFVEGFVQFTPASGVALHVPYMGFLGDWNNFDLEDYDATGNRTFNPLVDVPSVLYNWSGWFLNYIGISGYESTGLTWPTDTTAGEYFLGYTVDGGYDLNSIAINPNMSGIHAYAWMLRNAENVTVTVTGATGLVKRLDSVDHVWKGNLARVASGDFGYLPLYGGGNVPWIWDGKSMSGNPVADGAYTLNIIATPQKLVNEAEPSAPQTVSFPVNVDTSAPNVRIDSVTAGDVNDTIAWTTADAAPSSGIWGFLVAYVAPGESEVTEMWLPPTTSSAEIPTGADFTVYVWDNASNLATADKTTERGVTVSVDAGWSVITVPWTMDASTLTGVQAFAWDGIRWQVPAQLEPGVGYLVFASDAHEFNLTGIAVTSPVLIPGTGSFQLIGNPFLSPAKVTSDKTLLYVLAWDTTTNTWKSTSASALEPGVGYLIGTSAPGTLTITPIG
jgi:lactocepin